MKNLVAAALAGCLVASPVQAREVAIDDGNELLSICGEDDAFSRGYCLGYIRGLTIGVDYLLVTKDAKICYPDGVTWGQIKDVAVSYIRRNPAKRADRAIFLVGLASAEAWPCR